MVKCVSTMRACLALSLCHVFSQCCVISLQLRQVLLYSCCILLLDVCVNVCGGRRDGWSERICFACVCVCVRVSASLAVLCCHGNAVHMAQAASQPSTARVVLQEASLSL